jgi:hypothetical protein
MEHYFDNQPIFGDKKNDTPPKTHIFSTHCNWENSVSVFKNDFSVTPMANLRLIDLLECLRDEDSWESLCSPEILSLLKTAKEKAWKISQEVDEIKRKKLKESMPVLTPHGTVVTRDKNTKDKSFVPSGWIQIDIDGKDNPNYSAPELKQKMSSWPFVGFCCYSISGKGVWGLAPTNHSISATFNAIYQFTKSEGIKLDKTKGKAEAELRFISFDSEPYFNYTPEFIQMPEVEATLIPKVKKSYHPVSSTSKDKVVERLLNVLNSAREGSRHNQRLIVGSLAGGYSAGGLFSESEITSILIEDYTTHFPFDSPATQKKEIKAIIDGFQYGLGSPIYLVEEAFAIPFDGLEIRGPQIEITQGKANYLIDSGAVLERKPDLLYIKAKAFFELEPRPRREKHLTKKILPP